MSSTDYDEAQQVTRFIVTNFGFLNESRMHEHEHTTQHDTAQHLEASYFVLFLLCFPQMIV